MKFRVLFVVFTLATAAGLGPSVAEPAVVVLANRTDEQVRFAVLPPEEKPQQHVLVAGDVLAVPIRADVQIAFDAGGKIRREVVRANSIYHFDKQEERIELTRFHFSPKLRSADPPARGAGAEPLSATKLRAVGVLPVKILVDDDEPAVRRIWEERLRQRLAEASEIFKRACRIRFEVVAVGTWDSDNRIREFPESLREFESEVKAAPARLAIGFTSQYEIPRGRTHLGGTRGPLCSHVLIREWSQHITAPQRLEVLVHELGHFLGAAHSPDRNSVMRPVLKARDHRSHARSFRIGFDPLNTLALNLFSEELRFRGAGRIDRFSLGTKQTLRDVYAAMAGALPNDPAATQCLALLDRLSTMQAAMDSRSESLVPATQQVVRAVVEAAGENYRRPAESPTDTEVSSRLRGDRLTEYYFRHAAVAAKRLPPELAAKAYLLGLAVALDDSTVLRNSPILGEVVRRVESDQERARRLAVLGKPTMRARDDLTRHFAVSCGLTILLGSSAAEAAGTVKELIDCKRGTGFSFVDLSADMAGVIFATRVGEGSVSLATLASSFAVTHFLPKPGDLKEGIPWATFCETYGSVEDNRFHHRQAAIREQILALPGYRTEKSN